MTMTKLPDEIKVDSKLRWWKVIRSFSLSHELGCDPSCELASEFHTQFAN